MHPLERIRAYSDAFTSFSTLVDFFLGSVLVDFFLGSVFGVFLVGIKSPEGDFSASLLAL